MRTHGKKYRAAVATIEPRKLYAPAVAVEQVKQTAYAKFDESVDVAVRLGVDPSTPIRSCAARSPCRTARGRRSACS